MNRILIPVAIVVVIALWAFSAVVIVREDQQAVIRSFNAIQRSQTDAGLSFKLPSPFGSVDYIEKRVLATDPEIEQFILSDDTRLDVDYYVRYRITDPITYVRNKTDWEGMPSPKYLAACYRNISPFWPEVDRYGKLLVYSFEEGTSRGAEYEVLARSTHIPMTMARTESVPRARTCGGIRSFWWR